jgi:hypothetical protein
MKKTWRSVIAMAVGLSIAAPWEGGSWNDYSVFSSQ